MALQKKKITQKPLHPFFVKTGAVVFFVVAIAAAGDGSESALLNQLYNEIMGSTASRAVSMDSIRPSSSTAPGSEVTPGPREDATTDPSSDRLQQEIEKLMQDVRTRHSDAVKFMQDNNNR